MVPAACRVCGVFLAVGQTDLCPRCAEKSAARSLLRRHARLVALCMGGTAAMYSGPVLWAAANAREGAWSTLLFALPTVAALTLGAALTIRNLRPAPAFGALAFSLLCPNSWILALSPRLAQWLAFVGLAWLLSAGTAVRLWRARRQLAARHLLQV